jgi:signal transduction histidine kinase
MYPEKAFHISGSATLRCDSSWLGEACLNVLKNSCEHTLHNGKIMVLLDTSDASITITIEDNRSGVPEEELPGLFRRFSRSYRAAPKGGVGIGLAITKTIVEKHHGTIYAGNTADGLKITMCFPILDGILAINQF